MTAFSRPTMLLDQQRCERNIDRMVEKAKRLGLHLRPHFKTHQSAEIGNWFRNRGITKATVSSVGMAEYFYQHGWDDITIAFPFNVREWDIIRGLANRIRINLTLTCAEAALPLMQIVDAPVGIFLKLDVGTQRTGFLLDGSGRREVGEITKSLLEHPYLEWQGFLFHTGHTYSCRGREPIEKVHAEVMSQVISFVDGFRRFKSNLIVSAGDTPSCSVTENWDGIDEIRPGNFVFYDVTQWRIGSCDLDDIAIALACPVVAKHPSRQSVVVYGGGIHLSKDRIDWDGKVIFGLPVVLNETKWSSPDLRSYVQSLSQEHGVIKMEPDLFKQITIGDLVGILPVHSCMAADLMKSYVLTDNEQRIEMLAI